MKKKLKNGEKKIGRTAAIQTRRKTAQPFTLLNNYIPLGTPECDMYDALREAIPIIDAAIDKIVRLTGNFTVTCKNKTAERMLQEFLEDVKVGTSGIGINYFIKQFLDRLLTWGTAVAEIVPYSDDKIAALYCANNKDLTILEGKTPLDVRICTEVDGELKPAPHPDRIIFRALNPMPGELTGTSLLRGLPFVSSILLKIYNSIGTNFERIGNLRYAVTYKPEGSVIENTLGTDTINQISEEWSRAMNSSDGVRDFVAIGDVDIKVIGADNQIIESETPSRQMLEQIIAKLGIPPFMLGLSWSTTERMSQQQADILTSELEAYRTLLNTVIRKICVWQLRASGYCDNPKIVWDDINLQDEVEISRAELLKAQAESLTNKKETNE